MTLLDKLNDPEVWRDYYEYKRSRPCPARIASELLSFIEKEEYGSVLELIASGERFPLPKKAVISKQGSTKKRVVYTYPFRENTVLKVLTHLLLRKYDHLFSPALFSFRPRLCAKDAVERLTRHRELSAMYSYKADISNYFNSVDIPMLLPMLRDALSDDPELFAFLSSLLEERFIIEDGQEITEEKGIMAGTPQASFYANLFLMEMDKRLLERGALYCRYSDDIIVFAKTREELEEHIAFIRSFLAGRRLAINPEKEAYTEPGEKWTFLGFSFQGGTVDIAPMSVTKMKKKMRRKARALDRWRKRKNKPPEAAARGFIRAFNRKLYESVDDNDLTWARWFFPVITTAESLRVIDRYAEDCIRFLASGKRTKARFNVRYEALKEMGFRSLVHEYYKFNSFEKKDETPGGTGQSGSSEMPMK